MRTAENWMYWIAAVVSMAICAYVMGVAVPDSATMTGKVQEPHGSPPVAASTTILAPSLHAG